MSQVQPQTNVDLLKQRIINNAALLFPETVEQSSSTTADTPNPTNISSIIHIIELAGADIVPVAAAAEGDTVNVVAGYTANLTWRNEYGVTKTLVAGFNAEASWNALQALAEKINDLLAVKGASANGDAQ